jgi:hypothetical protein
MTVVKANNAYEDCALGKIGAEATPKRVPATGLVIGPRDLQEPVPDGYHDAPQLVD